MASYHEYSIVPTSNSLVVPSNAVSFSRPSSFSWIWICTTFIIHRLAIFFQKRLLLKSLYLRYTLAKMCPHGKCIHNVTSVFTLIPTSPSGHIEREEKNTSLAVPSLTFFKNPSKLNVRLPSTKTHLGKKNLTEVYSQSFPDKIERFDGYSVRFSLTFRACMTLLSVFNSHSKCFFMRKKISLFKVSQQVLVQISKNLLRHSVYCTQACHKYKNVYPKKGIQYDPFFACRYKHGRGFYVCLPFLCLVDYHRRVAQSYPVWKMQPLYLW